MGTRGTGGVGWVVCGWLLVVDCGGEVVDVSHFLLVQEVRVKLLLISALLRFVNIVETEGLVANESHNKSLEGFLILSVGSFNPCLLILLLLKLSGTGSLRW